MTAFWVTLILLIMYLFHVIEKFHVIPWLLIEMVFCGVWTILYFSTLIDCATYSSKVSALGAAAFFSFVAVGVYGYDAFLKWIGWRAGHIPQAQTQAEETQSL